MSQPVKCVVVEEITSFSEEIGESTKLWRNIPLEEIHSCARTNDDPAVATSGQPKPSIRSISNADENYLEQ